MKYSLKHEWISILFILVPFLYLWSIYGDLPEQIPIHWDLLGNIDKYGSKASLIIVPIILPLLVYIILTCIPIKSTANNSIIKSYFPILKIIMTGVMSALATYIIYISYIGTSINTQQSYAYTIIGLIFIILGYIFKHIKKNGWIGVRLPWTLASEENWNYTHKLASSCFIIGGSLIIITSMLLDSSLNQILLFLAIITMVGLPTLYSYKLHKKGI